MAPDREFLPNPVRRQRGRYEVIIHDHDLRNCATSLGRYWWRWRARQVGHTHRRFSAHNVTIEIVRHD